MSEYKKPIPVPSAESQPYWDGLREQKLMMPRCDDCSRFLTEHVESVLRLLSITGVIANYPMVNLTVTVTSDNATYRQ